MEEQEQSKDDYIASLEAELQGAQDKVTQLGGSLGASAYGNHDGNVIQYQLESDTLLEKLENFFRGKYIGVDDTGNQVWKEPEDSDSTPLNNYGITLMMETVTKYIDKNTSLSNYPEERIMEILADLGDELTLLIFCNYEKMGMDTPQKKTKYRILVVTTLHMIESAYRRAIRGKTTEELNQSRIVTQSDHIGFKPQMGQKKKGFGLSNLLPWG